MGAQPKSRKVLTKDEIVSRFSIYKRPESVESYQRETTRSVIFLAMIISLIFLALFGIGALIFRGHVVAILSTYLVFWIFEMIAIGIVISIVRRRAPKTVQQLNDLFDGKFVIRRMRYVECKKVRGKQYHLWFIHTKNGEQFCFNDRDFTPEDWETLKPKGEYYMVFYDWDKLKYARQIYSTDGYELDIDLRKNQYR